MGELGEDRRTDVPHGSCAVDPYVGERIAAAAARQSRSERISSLSNEGAPIPVLDALPRDVGGNIQPDAPRSVCAQGGSIAFDSPRTPAQGEDTRPRSVEDIDERSVFVVAEGVLTERLEELGDA